MQDAITESKKNSYYNYFSFGLEEYVSSVLARVRGEVVDKFVSTMSPTERDTILDVGVSANDHESSNFFERKYPWTHRITAVGLGDFKDLEVQFPGLKYVQGDGTRLPFEDGAFDYTYSHAVIEHVGNTAAQAQFVGELWRVARKGVFFTTPNRWHPIEPHTGLPFVQYLPKALHLRLFGLLGKKMYSTIDQLNLLTPSEVRSIAGKVLPKPLTVDHVSWLNIPSTLVCNVKK